MFLRFNTLYHCFCVKMINIIISFPMTNCIYLHEFHLIICMYCDIISPVDFLTPIRFEDFCYFMLNVKLCDCKNISNYSELAFENINSTSFTNKLILLNLGHVIYNLS